MNIKAQVPAEGVLLRKDYGDAKVYKIVCECGDCDHSHEVWIEADDYVTVTTFTEQKTNFWSRNRWQHIWQLLTKGYVQYEASIIMSEQQALNYAETLKSAVADVKEFKQDKK